MEVVILRHLSKDLYFEVVFRPFLLFCVKILESRVFFTLSWIVYDAYEIPMWYKL